jgi:hypothetical protein
VSSVRYELGLVFISQKTAFFIVIALKTSNHTEVMPVPNQVYSSKAHKRHISGILAVICHRIVNNIL